MEVALACEETSRSMRLHTSKIPLNRTYVIYYLQKTFSQEYTIHQQRWLAKRKESHTHKQMLEILIYTLYSQFWVVGLTSDLVECPYAAGGGVGEELAM